MTIDCRLHYKENEAEKGDYGWLILADENGETYGVKITEGHPLSGFALIQLRVDLKPFVVARCDTKKELWHAFDHPSGVVIGELDISIYREQIEPFKVCDLTITNADQNDYCLKLQPSLSS